MFLPQVHTYLPDQADIYRAELDKRDMIVEYGGNPIPYAHEICVNRRDIEDISNAAEACWNFLHADLIKEGGITTSLANRSPHLGGMPLNTAAINAQVERRFNRNWRPFFGYDVILAIEEGRPCFKLVEVQSAVSYVGYMEHTVRSRVGLRQVMAGREYYGDILPVQALASIRALAPDNGPIFVIDYPVEGPTKADKVFMAQTLNHGDDSYLISPLQISKIDGEYYCVLRSGQKVRMKNVLCRMIQSNLDALASDIGCTDSLIGREQVKTLQEFFTDPHINWIWHPTYQHIVDKASMPKLYRASKAEAFAKHTVPTYGPGERVGEKGVYVVKPTDGTGGAGQSTQHLETGWIVPQGYICQKRFAPYPLEVSIPPLLGYGTTAKATLELRYMPLLRDGTHPTGSYVMARLAPRAYYSGSLVKGDDPLVRTNGAAIMRAMHSYPKVNNQNQFHLPFGFGPVSIIEN